MDTGILKSIDLEKLLSQLAYNPKDPLLFNSAFFLIYLMVFMLIYQFLHKRKLSRVVLCTLFSFYFFYKACGFYFLLVILSAVVDFNLSNWIYRAQTPSRKKALLIFSVFINLALLAYFKYTDFFIEIVNSFHLREPISPLKLLLPIGISFYTFENLSYTIDVYRGKFKPVTSFLDYCFFLSFFPKLVMGPIVRASDFIPQIRQDIVVSKDDISKGLYLILGGLFKKVVISDYIYVNFVQYIFDAPSQHSGIECLFGVYGYAMVIYCDFSGYSDMAIGMGKWMGYTININFDAPYKSSNITEFWRRWHISLSSWLRDYLYISLGGNRKGKFRQYMNLFVTMLLGGLWHGANWKFVFWGAMHGIALAIDKVRIEFSAGKSRINDQQSTIKKMLGIFFTFHFVCFCWIFFKASSFSDGIIILEQIFTNFNGKAFIPMITGYNIVFTIMALGYFVHFLPKSYETLSESLIGRMTVVGRTALLFLFIWIIIQVKQAEQVMPIYLQF